MLMAHLSFIAVLNNGALFLQEHISLLQENNVKYQLALYFTFLILWRILSQQLNLSVLSLNSF